MPRQLWQIMLAIMVLTFAARLAAVGITLHLERGDTPLVVAYAIQGVLGLGIWASILWIPRTIVPAMIAYGLSVAGTSALEGFVFQQQMPQAAVVQIAVVLVFTAVAAYATHKTHLFGN
jgi:NCAIR mutase (PurE)-related protein